jgi:hemolysin-activating ACP:hemolysin acyltransferase
VSELALVAAKNGGGSAPMPPSLSKAKSANPREARQVRMAQSFSQVVAVLMRDSNFRNLKIGDLEWLVIPPIMAGQFKLGHAAKPAGERSRDGGVSIPVAVVLWARVSAEIDKRFSEELDKPMQLRPNQWASGDKVWIMATAGDRRALPHFMKELAQTAFKGQTVKMRTRTSEGKVLVKTLSAE